MENKQEIVDELQEVKHNFEKEVIRLEKLTAETVKNPTNNKEFSNILKEILALITNIKSHQEIKSDNSKKYNLQLTKQFKSISENIKDTFILYNGVNKDSGNKFTIFLFKELTNKFRNISDFIEKNESLLIQEHRKFPDVGNSLKKLFNELENFTDKKLIEAGRFYAKSAMNINPKFNSATSGSINPLAPTIKTKKIDQNDKSNISNIIKDLIPEGNTKRFKEYFENLINNDKQMKSDNQSSNNIAYVNRKQKHENGKKI